jgi:hypothetical protein
MFSENADAFAKTSKAAHELARHHSMIGGWRDTDVNELTMRPWARPSHRARRPAPRPAKASQRTPIGEAVKGRTGAVIGHARDLNRSRLASLLNPGFTTARPIRQPSSRK